jgi:hypothetical protein
MTIEAAALLTCQGYGIKCINENDLEGSKFGLSSKDKSTSVCRWNGSYLNPIKYYPEEK